MSVQDPAQLESPEGRAESRSSPRWLRLAVPLFFVFLIIASILFVAWYNYTSNRTVVLDLTNDLISAVEKRIESEVTSYLEPAAINAKLAAKLVAVDSLRMEPDSDFDRFGVELLRQHSQLAMLNAGDARGNFLMPKEFPDGSIDTKIIRRDGEGGTVQWVRRDPSGKTERIETEEFDGYDPRTRQWYIGASEARGLFWSDVYIFFTDRKPGMTAAYPVLDADGNTLGVLGVDIELEELCQFLGTLKIGETGRAMIVDDRGTVIAHPDVQRVSAVDGDKVRTVSVNEIDDHPAARAFARYQIRGHGRFGISIDGHDFIATVEPLDEVGRDWSVLVVVPEDDFIGMLETNNRRSILMSMVIVVIGLALAGLVAAQSLRADRSEVAAQRKQSQLESRSRAFSGVVSGLADANLTQIGVIQRMTEFASEGAEVRRVSVWRPEGDAMLRCVDAFERGAGHADGNELYASDYPGLFEALADGEPFEVRRDDSRLHRLAANYLVPLDLDSALMVPVSGDGRLRIWVWFERAAHDPPLTDADRSYANAVAGVLAMGCGEVAGLGLVRPETTAAPISSLPPAPIVHSDSDFDEATETIPATVAASRFDVSEAVELHEHALVLAVIIDDPDLLLAANGSDARPFAASVHRLFEDAAARGAIAHWMAAGSAFCGVALPNEGDSSIASGADALGRLALRLRKMMSDRLSRAPDSIPVRMAIDRGRVGLIHSPDTDGAVQVVGRAIVGAFALAQSAPPGGIQISDDAETSLEKGFVCRERGLFLVDGVGETRTYLLVGRLR